MRFSTEHPHPGFIAERKIAVVKNTFEKILIG